MQIRQYTTQELLVHLEEIAPQVAMEIRQLLDNCDWVGAIGVTQKHVSKCERVISRLFNASVMQEDAFVVDGQPIIKGGRIQLTIRVNRHNIVKRVNLEYETASGETRTRIGNIVRNDALFGEYDIALPYLQRNLKAKEGSLIVTYQDSTTERIQVNLVTEVTEQYAQSTTTLENLPVSVTEPLEAIRYDPQADVVEALMSANIYTLILEAIAEAIAKILNRREKWETHGTTDNPHIQHTEVGDTDGKLEACRVNTLPVFVPPGFSLDSVTFVYEHRGRTVDVPVKVIAENTDTGEYLVKLIPRTTVERVTGTWTVVASLNDDVITETHQQRIARPTIHAQFKTYETVRPMGSCFFVTVTTLKGATISAEHPFGANSTFVSATGEPGVYNVEVFLPLEGEAGDTASITVKADKKGYRTSQETFLVTLAPSLAIVAEYPSIDNPIEPGQTLQFDLKTAPNARVEVEYEVMPCTEAHQPYAHRELEFTGDETGRCIVQFNIPELAYGTARVWMQAFAIINGVELKSNTVSFSVTTLYPEARWQRVLLGLDEPKRGERLYEPPGGHYRALVFPANDNGVRVALLTHARGNYWVNLFARGYLGAAFSYAGEKNGAGYEGAEHAGGFVIMNLPLAVGDREFQPPYRVWVAFKAEGSEHDADRDHVYGVEVVDGRIAHKEVTLRQWLDEQLAGLPPQLTDGFYHPNGRHNEPAGQPENTRAVECPDGTVVYVPRYAEEGDEVCLSGTSPHGYLFVGHGSNLAIEDVSQVVVRNGHWELTLPMIERRPIAVTINSGDHFDLKHAHTIVIHSKESEQKALEKEKVEEAGE